MLIAQELAGRRVFIAHDDDFQRGYLSAVLIAAGAIVVNVAIADAAPGDLALDAAVVSRSTPATDVGPLLDSAALGKLPLLVVHAASAPPMPAIGSLQNLAVPYAGFQVVYALGDLLRRRHPCP